MLRTAIVRSVYHNGSVAMCDIGDEASPAVLRGCPIMGFGGGVEDDNVALLPTKGARVVYAPYGGSTARAIVLGTLPKASAGKQITADPEIDGSKDYPVALASLLDKVLRGGGAVIAVTQDGRVVLDTTKSGQPVNVQLPDGVPLRISQNGDEPTERVPLGGPLQNKLNEIVNYVSVLKAALALAATAAASTSEPSLAALGTALQTLGELLPADDSLLANAILVSSQSMDVPI